MMNQFNLSDWYDNDESDLYESIDRIIDYDDEMTDRLRRRILETSPRTFFSGCNNDHAPARQTTRTFIFFRS